MTLLACSLVLLGVAMLASASLRSLQDDVSLTYSTIDRLLAQRRLLCKTLQSCF
jgi:hypothetical protein